MHEKPQTFEQIKKKSRPLENPSNGMNKVSNDSFSELFCSRFYRCVCDSGDGVSIRRVFELILWRVLSFELFQSHVIVASSALLALSADRQLANDVRDIDINMYYVPYMCDASSGICCKVLARIFGGRIPSRLHKSDDGLLC